MSEWREEADGVFRGGGMKGLGLAGALLGFAQHPTHPIKRWVNVAGASAGSIIAAFLAVEGDGAVDGLKDLLEGAPYPTFEDIPGGHLAAGVDLLAHHGMARGDVFRAWFDRVLGDARFRQVQTPDGRDWRLKMTAVDVTRHKLLLLPEDLGRYRRPESSEAIDPNDYPIAEAVRMSMSIPVVFEPVQLVRDTVRCVDPGSTGLVAGAEVDRADALELTRRCEEHGDRGATVLARFAIDLAHTAQSAWDDRFVSHSTRVRTVTVDAGDVGTVDFKLDHAARKALVERGQAAATRFLDAFDPALYTNTYGARPPVR